MPLGETSPRRRWQEKQQQLEQLAVVADRSNASWPSRLVFVMSTLNGQPSAPTRGSPYQRAFHDPVRWWHNTSNATFVMYQRSDPSVPNYSPNYGFEAGVIVQFIVEHYAALPDVTIFVQDRPEHHNPHWLAWAQCLKPNVSYAPMTHARVARLYRANAQTAPGTDADDAIVEQCWRDMLDAFGVQLLYPREKPI